MKPISADMIARIAEKGEDASRFFNGQGRMIQPETAALTQLGLLRYAAKEGFDALDGGDYASLHSEKEIKGYLHSIGEEVSVS